MRKSALFVSIFLASLVGSFQCVAGAEEAGTTNGESGSATTLKGTVVKIEVTLNDLRDARLSISRARKAIANLYDEVTRQQVTMSYNPNLVGTTVIMVATPIVSGPVLPPRKRWVDASMSEIGPIIKLFKEDVDAAIESHRRVDVDDATRKELDPLRDQAFALVQRSFEIYKELEGLTVGPLYDNGTIASTTKNLDSQMKKLDQNLKKGISILQKEAKSAKRA